MKFLRSILQSYNLREKNHQNVKQISYAQTDKVLNKMTLFRRLQVKKVMSFPLIFTTAFYRTFPSATDSTVSYIPLKTVASIQNRTRSLVQALRAAKNEQSRLIRLEEFTDHILRYQGVSRSQAIREQAISTLLSIRKKGNKEVCKEAHKALTLLGWVDPVKGRGIKVLSIDGGGSR